MVNHVLKLSQATFLEAVLMEGLGFSAEFTVYQYTCSTYLCSNSAFKERGYDITRAYTTVYAARKCSQA